MSTCRKNNKKNEIFVDLNPIRSGGGGALKAPPPPPIFCSHAFKFGATLLCVGDFSQKIVWRKKFFDGGS